MPGKSRIEISIPLASSDGLFHGRYPHGDAPSSGGGATQLFSFPSGFAGAGAIVIPSDKATIVGSKFSLSTPSFGTHQVGAAWYHTVVDITSFTTDFTFQVAAGLPVPSIVGLTFCVQNSNATTNPLGFGTGAAADANLAGYGCFDPANTGGGQAPIGNSIAVKFDLDANSLNNYPSGGSPNSTGLYTNGGPFAEFLPQNDLSPYGINLYSANIMAAHIVYDGSVLTMTLRDTVTGSQYRQSWPVNIPACVGANTAFVGFTCGTLPAVENDLLTWSYSTGFNTRLATPTFSVSPGRYSAAQTVAISGPAGAAIYYTTNGLLPTSASTLYTGPLSVSASQVIQAVAIQSGFTDSVVGVGNYQIAASGSPLINLPSGFAGSGLINLVGYAKLSGSSILLTDTNAAGNEAGAAWYPVPVGVGTFTTHFTLQFTSANANGMTFCIQNQPAASTTIGKSWVSGGPNAIGGGQNGLGYSAPAATGGQVSGILSSVAVKFDLFNGGVTSTGLYKNGALPTTPQTPITGVNLKSGNPLNVTLAYDGTTLTLTIVDSVTAAGFSTSFAIDIPTTVGGSTAYVGFTGGTGGGVANQLVSAWTYATP